MRPATRAAVAIGMMLGASALGAQVRSASGPTVVAARAALFVPTRASPEAQVTVDQREHCGSALRNALMLGLGLSLAAGVLELTYTLAREPFVRRGHDVPRADPMIIAWAGGAGVVLGLVGTELCHRRGK